MKAVRIAAWSLGGIAVVLLLALGIAAWVIDGAFVKARLERAMQERHRTLTIEGVPRVRLFPLAGIAVGKVVLTEPSSDKVFLRLDSAEVAVRTLPLISGEVDLQTLRLAGLQLNLERGRDGRMNFADLAQGAAREPSEARPARPLPRIRLAQASIDGAQVSYRDASSGQEVDLGEFALRIERLDGDAPGKVSLSAHVTGRKPELDIRAQAMGAMRLDLAREQIGLEAFSLKVDGRAGRDAFALAAAAPKVEVTPARAAGAELSASLQWSGPRRNVEAKLRAGAVEGSASALSVPTLALAVDASIEGRTMKGNLNAPLKANLAAGALEFPKIAANLALAGAGLPPQGVPLALDGTFKADFGRGSAAGEFGARIEQSNLRIKFDASRLRPIAAVFALEADRLDLDRYLPSRHDKSDAAAGGAPKGAERIELGALKGPQLSGRIAIGALGVERVRLSEVKAEVKLSGGKLEVAPHSANLYGGTLAGSLAVDANANRVALKETVRGVQLGPLLREAVQQDRLEGRGNLTLEVASAGTSVAELKKALGGTARVELRDGAVKGINLGEAIQDVRSVLGSKSASAADPSKRTDFSEITASFAIRNGVAHNDDLQGKAPLLRLAGGGDVDLGNSTLNYLARVSVVASAKGQGGRDLSNLAGVTVPVKITGALGAPSVAIDFSELAAKSGAGIVKALGAAGGQAGAAKDKIGEKLRGLLRR